MNMPEALLVKEECPPGPPATLDGSRPGSNGRPGGPGRGSRSVGVPEMSRSKASPVWPGEPVKENPGEMSLRSWHTGPRTRRINKELRPVLSRVGHPGAGRPVKGGCDAGRKT
jgi:hypothetical protein